MFGRLARQTKPISKAIDYWSADYLASISGVPV